MSNGSHLFCANCGNKLSEDSYLCMQCGRPVSDEKAMKRWSERQRNPQSQLPYQQQILMVAHGTNGQLELLHDIIRIRKGKSGSYGEKEIQIRQISSIQFKRTGHFTLGYIQFSFSGGKERESGDVVRDPNSVMFNSKQEPAFAQIKNAIEHRMYSMHQPSTPQSQYIPTPQQTSSIDIPEQIRKLAELKDQGILTEEEFQTKKQELLSKM